MSDLLVALEQSFQNYKVHGARSNKKLEPLHSYIAKEIELIFDKYTIHVMGTNSKELKVQGKYYPKDIDIAVTNANGEVVFCLGIKFVTSNYKQNANNYFENMMGETANIQAQNIPYAQLIILRYKTPYYAKDGTTSKIETINEKDLGKYLKLSQDAKASHQPFSIGVVLIDIDENTGRVTFTNLSSHFKNSFITLLKKHLSFDNFLSQITTYRSNI